MNAWNRFWHDFAIERSRMAVVRFGFFGLLAWDLWSAFIGHAGGFGGGGFNVTQIPWLDALVPLPTPAIVGVGWLLAGFLAARIALGVAVQTSVRLLAVIKEILKRNAVQLVAAKKLADPDDLWFLTWGELFSIWDENAIDWGRRIARRRADLSRYEKLTPPLVVTSDGEAPVVRYQIDDAPEGALLGNSVSPGVVEGVVHVIRDPQRETVAPGDILVAQFTDPGWTPLFINAGGLILEVGGALTHGAVVAREYGIPAVVGVRDATKTLQTGQRVRVDGNRGIIEVL